MSLVRPAVSLSVDGRELTAPEAAAASVVVELGRAPAHDRAVVILHPLSPVVDLAAGAQLVIGLGLDADHLETVFTGKVDQVAATGAATWGGIQAVAYAPSIALSRTRVAQAYLGQSAADVIRDLLDQAGVDAGTITADLALAAYHVDERRPAWGHLCAVARLAGVEITSAPDGTVDAAAPTSGAPDHQLRHGAELLTWVAERRSAGEAALAVLPTGAGSEAGADRWHLLLKEPDGGAPDGPTLVPGAIRDRDAASTAAQALTALAIRRTLGGSALITGLPTVRPGQIVELTDLTIGDDVTARVLMVTHRLDRSGFTTRLALGGVA